MPRGEMSWLFLRKAARAEREEMLMMGEKVSEWEEERRWRRSIWERVDVTTGTCVRYLWMW